MDSYVIPSEVEGPLRCGRRHTSRRDPSTSLGMTNVSGADQCHAVLWQTVPMRSEIQRACAHFMYRQLWRFPAPNHSTAVFSRRRRVSSCFALTIHSRYSRWPLGLRFLNVSVAFLLLLNALE